MDGSLQQDVDRYLQHLSVERSPHTVAAYQRDLGVLWRAPDAEDGARPLWREVYSPPEADGLPGEHD